MPKTFHNGYEGGFSAGGTDVDITDWSGEESNPSVDVTTTGEYDADLGNAYTARWKTRSSFTGQINFPIDSAMTLDNFRAGRHIENVVLKASTGLEWTFPRVYIPSFNFQPGGMDDVNRGTISFESDGPYYGPGDTVPVAP